MPRQVCQRNATDGCFGLVFDTLLRLRGTVPVGEQEAAFLEFLFELVVAIDLTGVGDAEIEGFLQQVGLDLFQQLLYFCFPCPYLYNVLTVTLFSYSVGMSSAAIIGSSSGIS